MSEVSPRPFRMYSRSAGDKTRMILRSAIEPAKQRNPKQSEHSGDKKCGPPVTRISVDLDRRGLARLLRRLPIRYRTERPPIRSPYGGTIRRRLLSRRASSPIHPRPTEIETRHRLFSPGRERRQHRSDGVERNRDRKPRRMPTSSRNRPHADLPDRVSDSKGNDQQRKGRVVPMEIVLDIRPEDAECLPVDVVDYRGQKENTSRCTSAIEG